MARKTKARETLVQGEIKPEAKRRLEKHAESQHRSLKGQIEYILYEWLKQNEPA